MLIFGCLLNMDESVFLLVKDPNDPCRDIIRQRDGKLRILVFCLDKESFEPDTEEIQFYGNNNGTFLAFETSDYDGRDPVAVIEAIRWYADYIKNPKMEILAEDPRLDYSE